MPYNPSPDLSRQPLSYRDFCSPIKEPIQYCFQAKFSGRRFGMIPSSTGGSFSSKQIRRNYSV